MAQGVAIYSGWTPRSMRKAKSSSDTGTQREGKRNRLGNRLDRALYKNAKAHKLSPERYRQLCDKADQINGRKR